MFLAVFIYACSDSETDIPPTDDQIKMELESNVVQISQTVDNIHETSGYQLISVSEPEGPNSQAKLKTAPVFEINITLDDVKGVYSYSPSDPQGEGEDIIYGNIFTKINESENFIVQVPIEKVLEPWNLHRQQDNDDELENNLEIVASQYALIDSDVSGLDYTLNMSLALNESSAGNMSVRNISTPENANVNVKYEFTESIEVTVEFIANDNNVSQEFKIIENDEVIYKEKTSGILSEEGELLSFEIKITVDNIEFIKSTESDKYIVFRDGVQEENVIVDVIGECGSPEQGFCKNNLNLDITFEDGSKINLASSLGDETLNKMANLFDSMYQIYFVQFIVDNVAIRILHDNNQQNQQ